MTDLVMDQELPVHEIKAFNFAEDSSNKMHSDETAARYGFAGGLVPGVATFGYMTIPVAEALGLKWFEGGTMMGKFLKPIYHDETIAVHATVVSADPLKIETKVFNAAGTLCAVGEAGLPGNHGPLDLSRYPKKPLPGTAERLPASAEALPAGLALGSLDFDYDHAQLTEALLDKYRDPLPIYRGTPAVWHPALVGSQANTILAANVDLGPWIHTASDVAYCSLPRDGESLSLRGTIADAYVKRGHEFAVMDLALLGEGERCIARLTHTAIVRPMLSG